MFKIPLECRIEREFEANEEMFLIFLKVVDGLGGNDLIETDEAFLIGVLGEENFVLRKLGTVREGVVKHEAIF